MIINGINIIAFGGVTNLKLNITEGINIIYGENEKGKSTIEIFIKTMLYGFNKRKVNGENERKKYMPFNGEQIKGELIIKKDGIEYLIIRTFGLTKKEDTSIIINNITGEKISYINEEEPGKSLLGINRATFEKTLFISQLGVLVTKDKEEEIMDKITAFLGCGEEEVPVSKAVLKLNNLKREYVTPRGNGSLDILKSKEGNLREEIYGLYKISEENLESESELYNEKINKNKINNEIENLKVYKKYIKKTKLQEEYKDIVGYLRKSEELKRKQSEIINTLNGGKEIIDNNLIDFIEAENNNYLRLVDRREELSEEYKLSYIKLKETENKLMEYKYISEFKGDLKEELIKIKYKQETIYEKINNYEKIKKELFQEESILENKRRQLNKVSSLKDSKENIESLFAEYEKKLHELKFLAEKGKDKSSKGLLKFILLIIGIISIGAGSIISYSGNLVGVIFILFGTILAIRGIIDLKIGNDYKNVKGKINTLNKDIKIIEERLNGYVNHLKVKDFSELLGLIRKVTILEEKEELNIKSINEKKSILNSIDNINLINEFKKNNDFINNIRRVTNSNNIDEALIVINSYESIKNEFNKNKFDIEAKEKLLSQIDNEINYKEIQIREKLEIAGIEINNILDTGVLLKEYKDKIRKLEETQISLNSIEETYEVLLKDRNIEEIKNELQDILTNENPYSYNSEEEIEEMEISKNKELLASVKKIKDIENTISTKFIGKRDIVHVEEELKEVLELIEIGERKVKAIDLALDTLEKSINEIRNNIGPEINKRIESNFAYLTDNKYAEVKLSKDYSMFVNDNINLFQGSYLSNGAMDQLYLALRLALIELLFKNEKYPIILDDALIQYDDNRRERAILLITSKVQGQIIMFTCQNKEKEILNKEDINFNYIKL